MARQQQQRQQQAPPDDEGPVFVDDDHAELVAFAEKWIPEDTRDQFVSDAMTHAGYQRVEGWAPRRELDDDDQGAELDDGSGQPAELDGGGRGPASPARAGGPASPARRPRPRGGYFPRR